MDDAEEMSSRRDRADTHMKAVTACIGPVQMRTSGVPVLRWGHRDGNIDWSSPTNQEAISSQPALITETLVSSRDSHGTRTIFKGRPHTHQLNGQYKRKLKVCFGGFF